MKILIPNSFCFAAIGIVKTLKRLSKHKVYFIGTGEEPYGLASGSGLVDEYIQSPSIYMTGVYKSFLLKTIYSKNIDLIICVLDSDLIILDEIMNSNLSDVITYVNPGIDIIKLFSDKLKASKKMSELGFRIPKIILEDANHPLICRKNISIGSSGIKKVNLQNFSDFNSEKSFVQEYINGEEYTVDVFCDYGGTPHLIIPRKRLEIRNGMSFKTQLINDKEIIKETKLISSEFKIPGLWNIQFIKNKNGLFFIELNPRFAGSAVAGIVASFNYLDLYIDHFVYHKKIPSIENLMQNVTWGSIVTRYYEEISSSSNTSNVQ